MEPRWWLKVRQSESCEAGSEVDQLAVAYFREVDDADQAAKVADVVCDTIGGGQPDGLLVTARADLRAAHFWFHACSVDGIALQFSSSIRPHEGSVNSEVQVDRLWQCAP